MRSLLIPLRLATDARGLELVINLDPNIDLVRGFILGLTVASLMDCLLAAGCALRRIRSHEILPRRHEEDS